MKEQTVPVPGADADTGSGIDAGRRVRIWMRRNISDAAVLASGLALSLLGAGLSIWLPGGPYGNGLGASLGSSAVTVVLYAASRGRRPLFPEEEPVRRGLPGVWRAFTWAAGAVLLAYVLIIYPFQFLSALPAWTAIALAFRFRDGPTALHDAR